MNDQQIQQAQQAQDELKRALTPQEEKEMQDGFALEEMCNTSGWQVLRGWMSDLSYHSWVDPRGMKKEEWEWAELNAFHASNTATELLTGIEQMVSRAKSLHAKKEGLVTNQRMRF